ncbi:hypothetical protein [Streptomyces sp. NPDC053427]|uniref:hypothetical protein n=1 Tax=Streptomyces sp. NPDC053427 TaxID=3365701 RepID=UPI0037CFEA19
MTSPGVLAALPTRLRRDAQRKAEKRRIREALDFATLERTATRTTMNKLRTKADGVRREAAERDELSALYPQTSAEVQKDTEEFRRLADTMAAAGAHGAAAEVAYESAGLERAWFRRKAAKEDAGGRAVVAELATGVRDVVAPGYAVTHLWRREPGKPMELIDTHMVSKSRARSLIAAWFKSENGWVLRDTDDRLFVATPTTVLELVPTDMAPPHTEGDVLRAALESYGFPAYDDSEGGFTWLAVPLDPSTGEDDVYRGAHLRISAGEQADRVASLHDEVWGASVYDADGDYVTTLDGAPAGSSLAEDSAFCASLVAAYARLVSPK